MVDRSCGLFKTSGLSISLSGISAEEFEENRENRGENRLKRCGSKENGEAVDGLNKASDGFIFSLTWWQWSLLFELGIQRELADSETIILIPDPSPGELLLLTWNQPSK
uniref:Uncharacterized protein n=1 Tax=Ditylenchus dipsaci TaxID=166011 RepID=A0A915E4J4_9BILA